MNIPSFHKNRIIWLTLIVLISLGLVSVALAAADHTGKSITEFGTAPPQTQGGVQSGQPLPSSPMQTSYEPPVTRPSPQGGGRPNRSSPPSPMQTSYEPPVIQSPPDPLMEQMRLQAMADSQASNLSAQPDSRSYMLGELQRVEFWFNPNNMVSLWGNAQPDKQVTIQTSRGDTLIGWPDALDGNFGTDHPTLLLPGDVITVTAGDGIYPVIIEIPDIWANSDSSTDTVSGHTGIAEEMDVKIFPWWTVEMYTTTTSVDGDFSKLLPDIPRQGRGHIRFIEEVGPTAVYAIFHRPFYDLQVTMQVNYAHDWVESRYNSGYEVVITVTNEKDESKATAHGTTGDIPWWGGETGFSTGYNVLWDGPNPDLQAGDHVYLSLNGQTAYLRLGEISGELNVDTDIFTGSLNIPWLTDPVWVDCGVWVENGPGIGFNDPIDPNGGTFICNFGELGWDLQPGMDVGVSYVEPDGDRVYNVFRGPAPDLRINVWGQGQPAYDNNYVLEVHYNNDGWLTAPGLVITQTLEGMTYISDTTGFDHTGDGTPGNPLIWKLGDLPDKHMCCESVFYVFVQITDPSMVSTWVHIESSMAYYQDKNRSNNYWWTADFSPSTDTLLNIGKWSWTGDPVPGQDFVYGVNVCNNSPNPSS